MKISICVEKPLNGFKIENCLVNYLDITGQLAGDVIVKNSKLLRNVPNSVHGSKIFYIDSECRLTNDDYPNSVFENCAIRKITGSSSYESVLLQTNWPPFTAEKVSNCVVDVGP